MAEFPALPLWTDAYLADTGHLTTIEHGAYLLLLMAMWRAGGALPNDEKRLSRFAHMTAGQWRRIAPTIMAFFTVQGDAIVQGRLTDELAFVRQHRKKQSDNARARYRKTNTLPPATAEPNGSQNAAPTPTPTPTPNIPLKPPRRGRGSRIDRMKEQARSMADENIGKGESAGSNSGDVRVIPSDSVPS